MRILHLVGTLNVGGIERLVTDIALAQKFSGHDVAVCCLLHMEGELLKVLAVENVPVLDASYGRSPRRLVFRLSQILRDWKPDVIHSHVNFSILWQVIANIVGSYGAFILTQHTLLSMSPWVKFRSRVLYGLARPFIRVHTAVSEYAAEYAQHLYALSNSHRPIVIPNGIKAERYTFDAGARSRLRHEWNIGDDEILWGTVGRLDWIKGYDLLIQAFCEARESLPCIRLAIAGQGSERARLQAKCAELACAHAVSWLGLRQDVPEVLSAFDLYVQPSRNESSSLSVLEALANGLYIVASDVGGIREIARRSGYITLVKPEDSDALRDAIIRVTLKHNGKRLSSCPPEFTFQAMLEAYEKLYRRVVEGHRI